MKRPPHPVRGAYQFARTDIACPTCGADPYLWCRSPQGELRRIPCLSRLQRPLIVKAIEEPSQPAHNRTTEGTDK